MNQTFSEHLGVCIPVQILKINVIIQLFLTSVQTNFILCGHVSEHFIRSGLCSLTS